MRERRKTVTFDERCDVVEFDRMSIEQSFESSVVDDDDEAEGEEDEDDYFGSNYEGNDHDDAEEPSDSYEHEDEHAHRDDSIVGLVDSMLQDNHVSAEDDERPQTPTRPMVHSEDVDPDGIPYGRTHHSERAAVAHAPAHVRMASITDATPLLPPPVRMSTPPQQHDPIVPSSEGPLGRSTHTERAKESRADEQAFDVGVTGLPPSPSPRKTGSLNHIGGLVPHFALDLGPRGKTYATYVY
jgi:hypothetical protein